MPEYCLVTVRCDEEKWSVDLELPTETPLQDYEEELVKLLEGCVGRSRGQIRLFFEKTEFEPHMSLADCGAWDGAILTLKGA